MHDLASRWQLEDRIELKFLARLGWSWQRGSTCILYTPVGAIRVPQRQKVSQKLEEEKERIANFEIRQQSCRYAVGG